MSRYIFSTLVCVFLSHLAMAGEPMCADEALRKGQQIYSDFSGVDSSRLRGAYDSIENNGISVSSDGSVETFGMLVSPGEGGSQKDNMDSKHFRIQVSYNVIKGSDENAYDCLISGYGIERSSL